MDNEKIRPSAVKKPLADRRSRDASRFILDLEHALGIQLNQAQRAIAINVYIQHKEE